MFTAEWDEVMKVGVLTIQKNFAVDISLHRAINKSD